MSQISFDVPLVAQEKDFNCWHASANMVWQYWQAHGKGAGPMNTLPAAYAAANHSGIGPADFVNLAEKVGLSALAPTPTDGAALASALQQHGPLWAAGFWFGPGHVIVLTGIDTTANTVHFNDPDQGVKKQGAIDWFFSKLAKDCAGCLMYKNQQAY